MKKKILIIDDDADILDAIAMILDREGYTVSTVMKGDEAYQAINTFKPDLILLDVLMSGSDGRTICKNLKKEKKTRQIPIVMISAHPSAAKEYMQCGADDFLAKPFETEDLLKIIKKNLK
jgi:DNA-binding response OmpR family regulator